MKVVTLFFILILINLPNSAVANATSCAEITTTYKPEQIITILSIDGGGVRGIIPAKILAYIEKQTKMPISETFDVIMGTSTGAIIAAGLTLNDSKNLPLYTALEVEKFYSAHAAKIFSDKLSYRIISGFGLLKPKYSGINKKTILSEVFSNARLSELRSIIIIPAYSITTKRSIYFSNLSAKQSLHNDYYLADIIEGATAAPTFFPGTEISNYTKTKTLRLLDGAIFLNNPSLLAYIRALSYFHNKVFILVSLGTGLQSVQSNLKNIESKGLLRWANNILPLMFNADSVNIHEELLLIFKEINTPLVMYQRYDLILPKNIPIDDASPENIKALYRYSEIILQKNKVQMDELIKCLKYKKKLGN